MPRYTEMARSLPVVALVLLLGACATPPPLPPGATTFEDHRSQLMALEHWSFSGRVAIKTATSADSASLKWRQRGDDLEMTLAGPVGIKEATLTRRDGQLALLRNGERQPLDPYDDPLATEFGWSLPLAYLPFWLRGLPAPDIPVAQRELSDGRLSQLSQAGWDLEYTEYQDVNGRALPRRIRFSRAEVSGKILLKEWVL